MIVLRRITHGIRELMRAEAQHDPHAWAATAAGHAWIGMGMWGGLAVILDRWTAVYLAPLAYLLLIEGVQLAIAPQVKRSLVWDSGLDTIAFTFGCISAAHLGGGDLEMAMLAWLASLVPIAAGWLRRQT